MMAYRHATPFRQSRAEIFILSRLMKIHNTEIFVSQPEVFIRQTLQIGLY